MDKMMKKKLFTALAVVAVIAIVVIGLNQLMPKKQVGAKEIHIQIVNVMEDNTVLLDKKFHTDTETLYDFLVEQSELKALFETSSFGEFLVSLVDIKQGDVTTGPWWLYESTNNPSCKSAGMCPGVVEVMIQDKDDFTFKLTNSFE